MSLQRWTLAFLALGMVGVVAGCPSATVPVKPDQIDQADGGVADAGEAGADAGEADAGPPAPPPDAGQAQTEKVVPAGGDDKVETPEEKAGREAREKEEAEKKAAEDKRAAEEAAIKARRAEIDSALADAGKVALAGKNDEALKAYEEVMKKFPDSPIPHYNIGVLYDRLGIADKAITEYKKALEINPDLARANDNLDRLYIRTGRLEEAEENARRIPMKDNSVDAKNQLVRVLIAKGELPAAESLAKAVLKQDERNVDAMLSLGEIWYEQKKFELAKKVLFNAKEIDANVPEVWNLLAFVYLALDLKPEALKAFKSAAALREDFPEAHNNLGAMLNEANDCEGATRELETAVRFAPGYAQAHLNLGNAYRCSKRYEEAEKQYLKTLELDPKSMDAVFNLAILYLDGEMKIDWNKDDPEDSDKLERLKKAKDYFDKYRAAGGDDTRLDRYYTEDDKAIGKEQYRLKHLHEVAIKEKAREEARKAKEAAEKKAREERLAKIEALKVEGKEDIADEPPPAPPAPAPAPVSAVATDSGTTTHAVAPAPESVPAPVPAPEAPAVVPPVRHMQKIAPKEDEPDSGL